MAKNKNPNKNSQANPSRSNLTSSAVKTPEKEASFSFKKFAGSTKAGTQDTMVFGSENFKWMFIGIGILILGFFLMSGTTDIMSSTKIIIAPLVVLIGFAVEFYAILLNPIKKA